MILPRLSFKGNQLYCNAVRVVQIGAHGVGAISFPPDDRIFHGAEAAHAGLVVGLGFRFRFIGDVQGGSGARALARRVGKAVTALGRTGQHAVNEASAVGRRTSRRAGGVAHARSQVC